MSTEDNMQIVRQWVEQVWNMVDLDAISRFHPQAFINHGKASNVEEARQWHIHSRMTYPDIHYTIDDLFATEDRVALRWTATATHTGTLWGMIPPTGKRITWTGMHLLRLEGGRITEVWAVQDQAAQLQQMGVTLHPATT